MYPIHFKIILILV